MATYTLFGITNLDVSPTVAEYEASLMPSSQVAFDKNNPLGVVTLVEGDRAGSNSVSFNPTHFVIKKATAYLSNEFPLYANSAITFNSNKNVVTRVTLTKIRRGISFIGFTLNDGLVRSTLNNMILSGASGLTFGNTGLRGVSRVAIKNHLGVTFGQSSRYTLTDLLPLTGTTALSLGSTSSFTRRYPRTGSTSMAFAQTATRLYNKTLSGSTALTFVSTASDYPIKSGDSESTLAFGQSNTVAVIKTLSVEQSLAFLSGGYALV